VDWGEIERCSFVGGRFRIEIIDYVTDMSGPAIIFDSYQMLDMQACVWQFGMATLAVCFQSHELRVVTHFFLDRYVAGTQRYVNSCRATEIRAYGPPQ
jgi:hypothetical protein